MYELDINNELYYNYMCYLHAPKYRYVYSHGCIS